MGQIIYIKGKKREKKRKSELSALRRQGYVPAVCYGHGSSALQLFLDGQEARQLTRRNGNTLVQLTIEGEKEPRLVLLKEIQRNFLNSEIMHVDFQTVGLGERIKADVPVVLKGEDALAKQGLTVSHQLREVEVECLPGHLPEHLPIDVSLLKVGDKLLVKDIPTPPEVKMITEPEAVIIVVMPPGKAEAPPAEKETE